MKKYCLILLFFPLLFIFTACENQWIKGITSHMFATHKVGDIGPGGGIVFCVIPSGFLMRDTGERAYHLEVSPEPLHYSWASSDLSMGHRIYTLSGIGTGRYNTNLILATDPTAPAALACKGFGFGGLNDWYLPSVAELEELVYGYPGSLADFPNDLWTSEQAIDDSQDAVGFAHLGSSSTFDMTKTVSMFVIPIRAF